MKKEDFINTKWDARDWTPEGLSWWLSAMRELGIILVTEPSKRISPRFFIIRDEYIAFTDNKSHYDSREEKEMKLESILPQHVKHLEGQRAKARFDASIEATLTDRGNNYGSFSTGSELMQSLKLSMRSHPKWDSLESYQQEALEMIQHKIARIINGDPSYVDSWHDIGGYAKLVEDILNK